MVLGGLCSLSFVSLVLRVLIVFIVGLLTSSLSLLLWRLFLFLSDGGGCLRPLLVFVLVARLLLLLLLITLSLLGAVASLVAWLLPFVVVVLGFSAPLLILLHNEKMRVITQLLNLIL